jgi:DNA invertase Pin-like site-specific DNA recombinase
LICRAFIIPKVCIPKDRFGRAIRIRESQSSQIAKLQAAGCTKIFSEKVSGKNTQDRKEFNRLMKTLKPGDDVVVVKLDRLARSSRDLANILHQFGELGCNFTSLEEQWCDTSSPAGKLLFTIMSGVVEFERQLIRARCAEGIERAKEMEFGRPRRLDAGQKRKMAERYTRRARYRWPSSLKNTDAELRPCIALSAAALDGAALPSPRGLRPSGRIFSAFEEDPKRGPRRGRGPPISRGTPKIWVPVRPQSARRGPKSVLGPIGNFLLIHFLNCHQGGELR